MNRTQVMCLAALAAIETVNLVIGNYQGALLGLIGFASGFLMFRRN